MTEHQTTEEWRAVMIDGYDSEYDVSSLGRVKSRHRNHTGKILKGGEGLASRSLKARTVWIADPGYTRSLRPRVDKLVMNAFVGPMPDGHKIRHKNGYVWDDRLANLEYVDASIPHLVLDRLEPVDDEETAKIEEAGAWDEERKAREAWQYALELAVGASRRRAELTGKKATGG